MTTILSSQTLPVFTASIAQTVTALEARTLNGLPAALVNEARILRDSGVPSRHLDALLTERPHLNASLLRQRWIKDLTGLEGELRGRLGKSGEADPEEVCRLQALLRLGPGDALEPDELLRGVCEARRHLQGVYVSGFLFGAGIRPKSGYRRLKITYLRDFPQARAEGFGQPFLKSEIDQVGHSHTIRGALYFLLQALRSGIRPENRTLVSAPPVFQAEGVVKAARNLGFQRIQLHFPKSTRRAALNSLRELEVEVILHDHGVDIEAEVRESVQRKRSTLFLPRTNPLLAMGYATIGIEIEEQMRMKKLTDFAVVVPGADSSLIFGLAAYFGASQVPVYTLEEDETLFRMTGARPPNADARLKERPVVVVLPGRPFDPRDLARRLHHRATAG